MEQLLGMYIDICMTMMMQQPPPRKGIIVYVLMRVVYRYYTVTVTLTLN